MVNFISSFGRNGVHDFVLIRVTALIMTFYAIYVISFFALCPELTYTAWLGFWSQTTSKVFTMLTLICILIHGWIGLWQVLTDYIKSTWARSLMQLLIIVALFVYLLSGFFILWGV